MMVIEGFIAMVWAAAAMGLRTKLMESGVAASDLPGATAMIGAVCRDMLGTGAGMIAIIGVILLPITTGDSALRSLRLMIGEYLHIDQKPGLNRMIISSIIFAFVAGILYWAKTEPQGFDTLWRYFAWSNQTLAVFAFGIITIYLLGRGFTRAPLMSLLPGAWYMFIITAFICNSAIGFRLDYNVSIIIGVIGAAVYSVLIWKQGVKLYMNRTPLEDTPVY